MGFLSSNLGKFKKVRAGQSDSEVIFWPLLGSAVSGPSQARASLIGEKYARLFIHSANIYLMPTVWQVLF